ncbi:MAG: hypothetical protein HY234_07875 [Acidobacteria bacterium]|nr:hypothetical protein [Acidobacteriota bacterium]MBI3662948.1 hypothetical protein [Acidobacteriota bacterium]
MTVSTGSESYIAAVNDLFVRLKNSTGLDLELHPAWPPVILDQRSLNLGFKVHRRQDEGGRVVSLVIHPLKFDCLSDGTKRVKPTAEHEIGEAFGRFWSDEDGRIHTLVEILP